MKIIVKYPLAVKMTGLVLALVIITATFVGMTFFYGNQATYLNIVKNNLSVQTKQVIPYLQEEVDSQRSIIKKFQENSTAGKFRTFSQVKNNLVYFKVYKSDGSLQYSEVASRYKKYSFRNRGVEELATSLRVKVFPLEMTQKFVKGQKDLPILEWAFMKDGLSYHLGFHFLKVFNSFNEFGSDSKFYIFNRNNEFLFHPDRWKTFSTNKSVEYLVDEELDIPREFWINKKFSKTYVHESKDHIYSLHSVYIDTGKKEKWGVLSKLVIDKVLMHSKKVREKTFFITGILILFAIVCAWLLVKFLTKDLNKITLFAERYTRGVTEGELNIDSNDEIGILARTFLGMIRQVNQRTKILKKSEIETRKAKEEAERTSYSKSILLEDLKMQKEEIMSISKDKDELLAIVSHDLKNPLSVIKTSSEYLIEEYGNEEVDSDKTLSIRRIRNSANMAINLITDLLDMARLEGGIKLDCEVFNVEDLVTKVLRDYEFKLSEKEIELSVNFEGHYELNGDMRRISQVLSNILGNAIKFASQYGGIWIVIRTGSFDKNLEIEIYDNGPGIPEDKLESIFDKYEQARSRDRQIGTGLGLAICQKICELHGGSIWAESEEGKGAKFVFSLPEVKILDKEGFGVFLELITKGLSSETSENVQPIKTTASKQLDNNANVLFVDDSEDMRNLVSLLLKKEEISLHLGIDGVDGFEKYKNLKPQFVLLDINMPNLNGLGCLKAIRDYEKDNQLPPSTIVSMSANNTSTDQKKYLEAGFDYSVGKPFKKSELVNIFEQKKAA